MELEAMDKSGLVALAAVACLTTARVAMPIPNQSWPHAATTVEGSSIKRPGTSHTKATRSAGPVAGAPSAKIPEANLQRAAHGSDVLGGLRDTGERFADKLRSGNMGPKMVVVPTGCTTMGSRDGDLDERVVHQVCISRRIAVGVYEITFDDYDRYAQSTGIEAANDAGWGRGDRPVIGVSWNDAVAYARWLSTQTGKSYRLLSEAEWEYVARAGTKSKYSFGEDIEKRRANCSGCGNEFDGRESMPVGSFGANAFGLYDVHGNVWEWVQDCYVTSYSGAPTDGSARTSEDCESRVLRGGSWSLGPVDLRSSNRALFLPTFRLDSLGFRVAQDL